APPAAAVLAERPARVRVALLLAPMSRPEPGYAQRPPEGGNDGRLLTGRNPCRTPPGERQRGGEDPALEALQAGRGGSAPGWPRSIPGEPPGRSGAYPSCGRAGPGSIRGVLARREMAGRRLRR